jgi:Holliday junction resolvase RusA-like endonuclease
LLITSYTFLLEGSPVPKARPKVTTNGTFMPAAYRSWKEGAILDFRQQHRGQPVIEKTSSIKIVLFGKHSRRGDTDNIAGACLDALVQAGVLKGDNLMVVPRLAIELDYDAKQSPITRIEVLL